MEREIALHQRERRMASLLIEPGFTVRPVRATVPLHFRESWATVSQLSLLRYAMRASR